MQLSTPRLILREFTADDCTAVLAYQSEPLYLRYYPWEERSAADVQVFVQMFLGQQRAEPRLKYQFAVTLKSTGELIGNCGVRLETAEAHQADMGYELAPAHWGQGYATEAARAVVQFGFTELHAHRIWAECLAENVGSARVLKKLGMQQEGHLRQSQFFKGRYWDTLLFGLLKVAWEI